MPKERSVYEKIANKQIHKKKKEPLTLKKLAMAFDSIQKEDWVE